MAHIGAGYPHTTKTVSQTSQQLQNCESPQTLTTLEVFLPLLQHCLPPQRQCHLTHFRPAWDYPSLPPSLHIPQDGACGCRWLTFRLHLTRSTHIRLSHSIDKAVTVSQLLLSWYKPLSCAASVTMRRWSPLGLGCTTIPRFGHGWSYCCYIYQGDTTI